MGKLALARSLRHHAADFAEDLADVSGDSGHDRSGCHCHETSHKSILNQILPYTIFYKSPQCGFYERHNIMMQGPRHRRNWEVHLLAAL
jgi:hypothetical protein